MRTRFITTAPSMEVCPDLGLSEFAFVGRSNVGKSSLLNRVANAKIARTSRTPGRTQAINLFEVKTKTTQIVLADLPGFGYARAPKSVASGFLPLVEDYLGQRKALEKVFLLVDVRRGLQDEEQTLLRRHQDRRPEVEWVLVVTKLDKLKKAKRKPEIARIQRALPDPSLRCLGTSSNDLIGIDAVRQSIRLLSGDPGK